MTTKTTHTTLDDIARLLDLLQAQIDSTETRMGGIEVHMGGMGTRLGGIETRMGGMESCLGSIETRMVTKDDLDGLYASIFKLETIIKREAGDLGESIASLTNVVAKEFSSLAITKSKT